MKKLYFLILLSFVATKFHSQTYFPFPTDSAEWYNNVYCQLPNCPNSYGAPNALLQKGDTVINSYVYHKLYNKTNNTLFSFYREFNKKIYSKYPLGGVFGNDTAEFVLYDFNLNVGDTVYIKVPASWSVYVCPFQLKRVIASISNTLVLPSGTHKTFNFSAISGTCCAKPAFNWIEGVGSDVGLLYNMNYEYWSLCISYPGPYYVALICNFRNGVSYYPTGCVITSVHNSTNILSENVNIFPNPNSGQQNIIVNATENIKSVTIKDLLGKEVKFISNINSTEYNADLNSLSNGVYIITIGFDGKTVSSRLIKN